jgi:hypothetical protein
MGIGCQRWWTASRIPYATQRGKCNSTPKQLWQCFTSHVPGLKACGKQAMKHVMLWMADRCTNCSFPDYIGIVCLQIPAKSLVFLVPGCSDKAKSYLEKQKAATAEKRKAGVGPNWVRTVSFYVLLVGLDFDPPKWIVFCGLVTW